MRLRGGIFGNSRQHFFTHDRRNTNAASKWRALLSPPALNLVQQRQRKARSEGCRCNCCRCKKKTPDDPVVLFLNPLAVLFRSEKDRYMCTLDTASQRHPSRLVIGDIDIDIDIDFDIDIDSGCNMLPIPIPIPSWWSDRTTLSTASKLPASTSNEPPLPISTHHPDEPLRRTRPTFEQPPTRPKRAGRIRRTPPTLQPATYPRVSFRSGSVSKYEG